MRLKELREDKKLTQQEVASAIGGNQSNLAKWEKGKVEPTSSYVVKLANYFNVSTDYLLGRTDELGSVTVPNAPTPLPDDEQQLLSMFRKMTHAQKIRVVAYSEGLLSTGAGSQFTKTLK